MAALAYSLGRPDEAEAVLDAVASAISDDAAALKLAAIRTVLDVHPGRTAKAAEAAAGVLAHPQCTPTATQLASWGLAAACGPLGRLDGLGERVRWIDVRAESFETGLHQAAIVGSSWVRGLLLAGLLDQADRAARRYREHCQDTPGPGDVTTSAVCGQVAKSADRSRLRRGGSVRPSPAPPIPAAGRSHCSWTFPVRSGWLVTRRPHAEPLSR